MDIILAYPAWYIVFCLLLATLASWFLYFREKELADIPRWLLNSLRVLRFVAVFIICFLLLAPLLLYFKVSLKKPVLIVLQDNSQSLLTGADSLKLSQSLDAFYAEAEAKLERQFEIKNYRFGEALSQGTQADFSERSTNLHKALSDLYIQYGSGNHGILLLASDGLINEGRDPYYNSNQLNLQVYALGLGDTSTRADLRFADVRSNQIAYLGNEFPLEMVIRAENLKAREFELRVLEGKAVVYREKISLSQGTQSITKRINLEAKTLGLRSYKLELDFLEEEWTHRNNVANFSVEVIDSRAKILLVHNKPHPDIAALKESLNYSDDFEALSKNYEAFERMSDEALKSNFNLLIFHGIPVNVQQLERLKSLLEKGSSIFIVLTQNTDITAFNALGLGLRIKDAQSKQMNEVLPNYRESFKLFRYQLPERWQQNLPPMKSPFGNYEVLPGLEVLFEQKLGKINTGFPLLAFSNNTQDKRYGILAGEGIWRWRLFDYRKHGNMDQYNDLITSSVRYLANKDERGRFRLDYEKRYFEGDELLVKAELYNPSFEPVIDAEVALVLRDEADKSYEYTMSPAEDHFEINIKDLKPGNYTFEASTRYADEDFVKSGAFVLEEKLLEFSKSRADHQWLKRYAEKNAGAYYHLNERAELLKALQALDIKPVSSSRERFRLLIDFPWLFVLMLLPFVLEWFIRRRYGSY